MVNSNAPAEDANLSPEKLKFAEQQRVAVSQIFEKVWNDSAFRDELLSNPDDVLRRHGVYISDKVHAAVVFESEHVHYFVVPSRPNNALEIEGILLGLRLRME